MVDSAGALCLIGPAGKTNNWIPPILILLQSFQFSFFQIMPDAATTHKFCCPVTIAADALICS